MYEYLKIAEGLASSNYQLFNSEIEKYQKLWITRKLYFFMQDLQLIFNRNLFKKVYQVINMDKKASEPSINQIDIHVFRKALDWQQKKKGEQGYDVVEIECLLANLIFKGFIKGYILHEEIKRILVLSRKRDDSGKGEPFPKISYVIKRKYS